MRRPPAIAVAAVAAALAVAGVTSASAASRTIHVLPGADPANASEGSSWAEPTNLQRALALAAPGDEVWVASGVYFPDEGQGQADNDRESTFQLRDGVAVYGGFAGSELALDERDLGADPPSVLSGDLLGNDGESGRAFHVVTGTGVSRSALLDGFTVTLGGRSRDEPSSGFDRDGGGLLNAPGSPTVRSCHFHSNEARSGGAVASFESSPLIVRCEFRDNRARIEGGAIYSSGGAPGVYNTLFVSNVARLGGAMCNDSADGVTANCLFYANEVHGNYMTVGPGYGRCVFNRDSSPTVVACTIAGNNWPPSDPNFAVDLEAGIANSGQSFPKILNSIFHENDGGSVYNLWERSVSGGSVVIARPHIAHCVLPLWGREWWPEWGVDGGGNVDLEPRFIDYTSPTSLSPDSQDLRLRPDTPCMGLGDPSQLPPDEADLDGDGDVSEPIPLDFAGNPRVHGLGLEPGAFEQLAPGVLGEPDPLRLPPNAGTIEGAIQVAGLFDASAVRFSISGVQPLGLLEPVSIDPATGAVDVTPGSSYGSGTVTIAAANAQGFTSTVTAHYEVIPPRLYVDASATGDGTGLTWEHAFTTLQDALVDATDYEVWVASGVYYPDEGGGMADGDGEATFSVPDGVRLYGGFAGGEMTLAERDVLGNPPSVLSGDISQDDRNDDGNAVAESASDVAGENSYSVVLVAQGVDSCLIDGFTVTAAARPESPGARDSVKGGIHVAARTATVANCNIVGNNYTGIGSVLSRSSPEDGLMWLSIERCTLSGNAGGAIGHFTQSIEDRSLRLSNSLIAGNEWFAVAAYGESAWDFHNSWTVGHAFVDIANCTIVSNMGELGTFDFVSARVSMSNSIVWDNAGEGWSYRDPGSLIYQLGFSFRFAHSILEDSGGSEDWIHDGSPEAPSYLRILIDLGGNLDVDPQFVDPAAGDYRLAPGSPGIDAGGSASGFGIGAWDVGGGMRTLGPAIDIGAYEFYDPATADSDRDGWTDEVELAVDGTATGLPFPQTWSGWHEDPDDGLVYPVIGLRADARVLGRFDIFIDHAVSLEQDTAWAEIEPALLSSEESGGTVEAEFLAPAPAGAAGYFRLRMQLR